MKKAYDPSESSSPSEEQAALPGPLSTEPPDSATVSFASLPSRSAASNEGRAASQPPVDEHEQTVISQRPAAPPEEFYGSISLAELAKMLEGKQLDHFSVEHMVGGGGMGAVFRGVDMRLDRVVAIKVIPSSRRDAETLRRFRLEAQSAARLDHPNIARVYYVGESGQWNYIVFEFIEGINVRDLVEMEGPLSIDDAVYYTRQVAEALQHAHDRDVVHRDIKPSNILITASGIAKLVDMGLARDTSLDRSNADATASGMTLGTFDYISPEQARNPRDADVRSDLYSLGCTLFFMLTGHAPFPEGTALQKLLNHGSQPPPDPRGWRQDISDELFEVIIKLMAKRPADRYQKPSELVNDLMLVAELESLPRSQGPTTLMLSPSIAQRSLLEANLPWMVALAFLLGSTLWLQSVQSLSNGFALPELKFKPPESSDVVSTDRSAVSENVAETSLPDSVATTSPTTAPPSRLTEGPRLPELSPAPSFPNSTNIGRGEVSSREPAFDPAGAERQEAGRDHWIVSSERPSGVAPEQWKGSLPEAIAAARSQSGTTVTIELRGRVRLDERLVIEDANLRFEGSEQHSAFLSISSGLRASLAQGAKLIQVRDAELSWTRVAFEIDLPDDGTSPSGSRSSEGELPALFGISGNSTLRLEGCSTTAIPSTTRSGSRGAETAGRFAVFELLADSRSSLAPDGLQSSNSVELISVTSSNCVFRGAGLLVRIRHEGTEARDRQELSFQDTLVAVSDVALHLTGSSGELGGEGFVKIFADHTTFITPQGFARMEYSGDASPLLGLNRRANDSVFWSSEGVPHISIYGGSAALVENPNLLLLKGSDNAYDENLRDICQTFSGGTGMFDFSFADGQQEGWLAERGTERLVRWSSAVAKAFPLHTATASDFELDRAMAVPGYLNDALKPPVLE